MYRLQCIEKTYNNRSDVTTLGDDLVLEECILDRVIKSKEYLVQLAAKLSKQYHLDSTFKSDGSGYLFNLNTVNYGPAYIEKFYNLIITKDSKPLDTYASQSINFKILKRSGVRPVGRLIRKRLASPATISD